MREIAPRVVGQAELLLDLAALEEGILQALASGLRRVDGARQGLARGASRRHFAANARPRR